MKQDKERLELEGLTFVSFENCRLCLVYSQGVLLFFFYSQGVVILLLRFNGSLSFLLVS